MTEKPKGAADDMAARIRQLRAELRPYQRAERDRLVRAGHRRPRSHREAAIFSEGLAERFDRPHGPATTTSAPPTIGRPPDERGTPPACARTR